MIIFQIFLEWNTEKNTEWNSKYFQRTVSIDHLAFINTSSKSLTSNGCVERTRHPHGPRRPQHLDLLALVDEHLVEGGQGVAHLRHDDAGHVDEGPLLAQRHAAAYGGGDAQPLRYQDLVRQELLHEHSPQAGLYLRDTGAWNGQEGLVFFFKYICGRKRTFSLWRH